MVLKSLLIAILTAAFRTQKLLPFCQDIIDTALLDASVVPKSSGEMPWIGTRVLVYGRRQSLKAKTGVVRDVICGQNNDSGLRIIIILDNFDPTSANKEFTVDYEHVLEVTYVRYNV